VLPSVNFKSHLGRYELLAKVASGGMGEIFLARLEGAAGFEKLFVVKRILPHLADDLRFRGMLIDEARIASKLSHPNICQVYELGETDGELYIVMEYLEGVTLLPILRHAVQQQRPLELGLVGCVIQQITEALHYAHELRDRDGTPLNIVHRDVTPSNIFVTESGVAKVLDFGIAKARNISSNTQTGTIKGKHAYMAPEQLRGAPLDRRVDVFAVGILLFEMLALRRLFQRRTDYLTLQAVMEEPIPDVRRFRGDLPPALVAVLGGALQRDRDLRLETVRQLGAAVVDAVAGVERVWSASELGDQLGVRFGAELRRRNTAVLSAVSRPAGPSETARASTGSIPSLEELEVRGAPPRARTRGSTHDGATDVEIDAGYDHDDDESDDLPWLGSAGAAGGFVPGHAMHATSDQPTAMIDRGVHSGPITIPPYPVAEAPRRRSSALMIGGIAAVLLAAAAVIAAILWSDRQQQQPPTMVVVERGNASSGGPSGDGSGPAGAASGEGSGGEPAGDGSGGAGDSDGDGSSSGSNRDGKLPRTTGAGGSKNELRKRINTLRPEITRCLSEHASAKTTDVEGTVVLHIDRGGEVSSVELQPATLAATPLATCIRSTFSALRFPEQREALEIKVPFSTKLRPAR
jgi:eukaryotic-like serine/threonine-protein kinase